VISEPEFIIEFSRTLRMVLQKHEIEVAARGEQRTAMAELRASPESSFLKRKVAEKGEALLNANFMLDGAIAEQAQHLYTALNESQTPAVSPSPSEA
jgi:hypothetical protein